MEPFKEKINRAAIERLAERLWVARPKFPVEPFVREASRGLLTLELKDRVRHVAKALRAHLNSAYLEALAHVLDSLPPPLPGTEEVSSGFELWPLCHFVEEYGLEEIDASVLAMRELTKRFSCEFAIRPYLLRDANRVFRHLRRFVVDDDPHVRRLASEGTRPRLPWGQRLDFLVLDPKPARFVLDSLYEDREEYVRRSVANHVNDIAKDHPEYALEVCRVWRDHRETPGRIDLDRLIRHALRTLAKNGDPATLRFLGFEKARYEVTRFELTPSRIRVGESTEIGVELRSRAPVDQNILLDLVVGFRRADGSFGRKVFRWKSAVLAARGTLSLRKKQPFRQVTTRRLVLGPQRIEIQINGDSAGVREVELR